MLGQFKDTPKQMLTTNTLAREPRSTRLVHLVMWWSSRCLATAQEATMLLHVRLIPDDSEPGQARTIAQWRAGMYGGAVTLHHLCCANACAWVMYVQESIGTSAGEDAHYTASAVTSDGFLHVLGGRDGDGEHVTFGNHLRVNVKTSQAAVKVFFAWAREFDLFEVTDKALGQIVGCFACCFC